MGGTMLAVHCRVCSTASLEKGKGGASGATRPRLHHVKGPSAVQVQVIPRISHHAP